MPSSPAESDCTNFPLGRTDRLGVRLDVVDEPVDQGSDDGIPVLQRPRPEKCHGAGCVFSCYEEALLGTLFGPWCEAGDSPTWERVSLKKIWKVDFETLLCVFVCYEASIGEFPAEDIRDEDEGGFGCC